MEENIMENLKDEIQAIREERLNLEKERKKTEEERKKLEEERIKIEKARIQLEEERLKKAKIESVSSIRKQNNTQDQLQDDLQKDPHNDPEIKKVVEELHKKEEEKKRRKKNNRITFFMFVMTGMLAFVAVVLIRMNNGESIEEIFPFVDKRQSSTNTAFENTSDLLSNNGGNTRDGGIWEPNPKKDSVKMAPNVKHETTSNVTPEVKDFLDAYESFMNRYCDFMENYDSNNISALTEYMTLLKEYSDYESKANGLDTSNMTEADYQYYIDVMARVSKRMLTIGANQ